jgi:hypothetical protein
VQDDGEGIAPEERDRVFSAFHGADRGGSAARSGLGLAIVRATVQAHGGRIWVADSQSGTRVRLSLPTAARRCPRLGKTSDDSLSTALGVHTSQIEMEPSWPHYIPPHPSMS